MKRFLVSLGAAALLAAPAGAAVASHGADDGPGHVRHGHHRHHGADDRSRAAEAGDDHGRRHGGHGADDAAGHQRHGGAEPGDDRGRRHGGHGADD